MSFITDKVDKFIKDNNQHYVIGVFDSNPIFSYSIGLSELHNIPELIIVGVDPKVACYLINTLAEYLIENPANIIAGKKFQGYSQNNFYTLLSKVHSSIVSEYAVQMEQYYISKNLPTPELLQVLIPDRQNKFFYDEGFDINQGGMPPDVLLKSTDSLIDEIISAETSLNSTNGKIKNESAL